MSVLGDIKKLSGCCPGQPAPGDFLSGGVDQDDP